MKNIVVNLLPGQKVVVKTSVTRFIDGVTLGERPVTVEVTSPSSHHEIVSVWMRCDPNDISARHEYSHLKQPELKGQQIYKITKAFQGGLDTYYAVMPAGFEMPKEGWDYMFEEWGESTNGGHNYGYRMKATKVRSIPKPVSEQKRLHFRENFLRRKEAADGKA